MQPVFSFKIRGAFNKMASLPKDKLEQGVICSSAGNHAQGVALSAQYLGTSAVICMPVNTPEIKVQSHLRSCKVSDAHVCEPIPDPLTAAAS